MAIGMILLTCWSLFFPSQKALATSQTETVFKAVQFSEPSSLDPSKISTTETLYVFNSIYRGLFWYDKHQVLRPEGAKRCWRPEPLKLVCDLNKAFKWSDGTDVVSGDYVNSFRHLLDPKTKAKEAGLLLSLKNAREILKGQKKTEELGVFAPRPDRLEIQLAELDSDLEYKLAVPVLAPVKKNVERETAAEGIYNGPYLISSWEKGKRVLLKPNPFYPLGRKDRPPVEILFFEDETAAVNLFEKGMVDFVPRLTEIQARSFQSHPGFFKAPFSRFDYIGFGPELQSKALREALVKGVNFKDHEKIFHSEPPGCPSFPDRYLDRPRCYFFNPEQAKLSLAKVSEADRKKLRVFLFPQGSDDLRRGMEWYQGEWKKNLGIQMELQTRESKVFVSELKTSPPAIFRKSLPLDRPTCLAALENFTGDNSENLIRYNNPKYDQLIGELQRERNEGQRKILCGKALQVLLDDFALIPLGRFAFFMVKNPKFDGVDVNELNHLDLSNLSIVSKK